MNYLIDTQIVIWFQLFDTRLSPSVYDLLTDGCNAIFVSQISLFEIAIKQKVGKLPEFDKTIDEIIDFVEKDNFEILPVKNRHITFYNKIPLHPQHKDPFDRLIIAAALSENLPIISANEKFRLYVPQIQFIEV